MRIISQDHESDLAYDNSNVFITYNGTSRNDYFINLVTLGMSCAETIGTYSTKEKALKVMEMIRDANSPFLELNSKCEEGYINYNTFKPYTFTPVVETSPKTEQIGETYFQMPQDSEVDA